MKAFELVATGLPQECIGGAYDALKTSGLIADPAQAKLRISEIVARPDAFVEDPHFGALAQSVRAVQTQLEHARISWGRNPHGVPDGFAQWGEGDDPESLKQMSAACELPVAVQALSCRTITWATDSPLAACSPRNSVIPMASARHCLPDDVHDHGFADGSAADVFAPAWTRLFAPCPVARCSALADAGRSSITPCWTGTGTSPGSRAFKDRAQPARHVGERQSFCRVRHRHVGSAGAGAGTRRVRCPLVAQRQSRRGGCGVQNL